MAIRPWKCKKCNTKEIFFDHEEKICPKCQSTEMKKLIGVPLQSKNTETMDKYHNIKSEVGVSDDLQKRSTKHVNDTLDEMILEHGEEIAKERGWLRSDDGGKTWRKRNDFDTNTLNATNSGTSNPSKKD